MRNRFFIACVAAIIFSMSLCALLGYNTTNESIDKLEKAIEKGDNDDATIVNNYNKEYHNDNSTTNITNNYNNDIDNNNYDNNTVSDNNEVEEEDDKVVKVYVTEGTIVDESGKEDYREYNDYSDSDNNSNSSSSNDTSNNCDTITPIGNIKNDMDPDPNVVHIKNIKCPNCGAYSYIEHYNIKDENLLFYMGVCNSCGFER